MYKKENYRFICKRDGTFGKVGNEGFIVEIPVFFRGKLMIYSKNNFFTIELSFFPVS